MERENVLNEIFKRRINIDFKQKARLKKEKLFGEKINCPVRELVLILYDLERELKIKVSEDDIVNGKFDTYNHILEIISR